MVTRTVTYCRTPLEPAPRGKRRKLDAPAAEPSSLSCKPLDAADEALTEKNSPELASENEAQVKKEESEEPTVSAASTPPKEE